MKHTICPHKSKLERNESQQIEFLDGSFSMYVICKMGPRAQKIAVFSGFFFCLKTEELVNTGTIIIQLLPVFT